MSSSRGRKQGWHLKGSNEGNKYMSTTSICFPGQGQEAEALSRNGPLSHRAASPKGPAPLWRQLQG